MRRRFALLLGLAPAIVLLCASPVHAQAPACNVSYDAATAASAQTEPAPPVAACGGAAPAVAAAAGLSATAAVAVGIAARNFSRGASSPVPTPAPAGQPGPSSPPGPSGALGRPASSSPHMQTTHRFKDNYGTWKTGEHGPFRATGVLRASYQGPRSAAEKAAQLAVGQRGGAEYQGGHLLGHRFLGAQGLKNLFAQHGQFNNSAFKTFENELADWTKRFLVWVEVELFPPNHPVPDHVTFFFEILDPRSGKTVFASVGQFDNAPGELYPRRSARWIESMWRRIESRSKGDG